MLVSVDYPITFIRTIVQMFSECIWLAVSVRVGTLIFSKKEAKKIYLDTLSLQALFQSGRAGLKRWIFIIY